MKLSFCSSNLFCKNKFVYTTLIIGSFFVFSACANKVAFNTSTTVPAARGYAKVKKDGNGNYKIAISIRNLAEVNRLQPPKKAYIVWVVADNLPAKNVGLISSDSKMFSQKLKAYFETVSATKPTKIFITAEDDVATQTPTYINILETNSF